LVVSSQFHEKALKTEVDLVVEFVNSRDVEERTDALADPAALPAWVAEHTELAVAADGDVDPDAHRRLLELREALRDLLRANAGEEGLEVDLSPLREAAAESRYSAALAADGRVCINADGDSVQALEARVLLAMELIQLLGAWPRVKACAADDCQWAFYDTSRNRSRTWCSMEVCGNREKTRRYRGRRAAG
jgi:predicted RNA-binding Zn ribbon-like protein